MRLGFSTQLGNNLIEDINFAKKNNFNTICLELSWNPNLNFSKKEFKILKQYSEEGNTICIHMPFFLYVNTSIDEIFFGVKEYFEKVFHFSNEIGVEIITFHTGYNEQIGDYKTQKYLIKNLKYLSELSKKYNLILSIENDDKHPDYPLWDLKEVERVLKEIKNLAFTYDPGHANTANYEQSAYKGILKERTNIVHLHNNLGKDSHNSLDKGDINFEKFLYDNYDSSIIYILEIFPYEKISYNKRLFMKYISNIHSKKVRK